MLANACTNVVIVSPFIKRSPFDRLVASISDNVELTCVTRWRLQEVASGISDPSIWETIKNRGNSSLWLRGDLHAKYYRVDRDCVIGSANLTDTGLGWRLHSNLELLVRPADPVILREEFEEPLIVNSTAVDDALYRHVVESSARLMGLGKQFWDPSAEEVSDAGILEQEIDDSQWLPETRHPENLYSAYAQNTSQLTTAAQSTAERDLQHFILPPDLPQEVFDGEIGIQLLAKPLIRQIDAHLSQPRRFGEVTAFLSKHLHGQREVDIAWQTTMRWLRHFLPTRYALAVPSHTEIMYRVT